MKIKLLLSTVLISSTTIAFGQINIFNSHKQHQIHPTNPVSHGVGTPGETCDAAITANTGLNITDGPSSGGGCGNCSQGAVNADWLVYQATGAGTVSISSCLQGVDTRVWIYESSAANCSAINLIAGNDDFCEQVPGGDELASFIEFSVCSGNFYYIEWDDSWDASGFSFSLSFTPTTGADIATSGNITEYTKIPKSAAVIDAAVGYKNIGSVDVNNLQSEFIVTKNGSPFHSLTTPGVATLATCGDDVANASLLTQDAGTYNAQIRVFANENETNTINNLVSQTYIVDTVYARDNGTALTVAPLDQEGIIGHTFYLPKPDRLTSVSIKLAESIAPGTEANVKVYSTDASGKPTTLIGSTVPHTLVDSDTTGWLTLRMADGFLDLPAGNFFVGNAETATSNGIPIGICEGIYTPNVAWINIPGLTLGFMSIEEIGVTGITLMLRANFGQTYSWASVEESNKLSNLKLMPNPTADIFTISFDATASKTRISVIDATGKLVKDEVVNGSSINHSINLSNYSAGIYTVRIISGNEVINRKLILAH